eukprot:40240-Eustigmatos_ZCMA.PRE.1
MLSKSLVAASVLSLASAYSGDGTFYGAGGAGGSGACMLQPGFNGVGITVAMNVAQYESEWPVCSHASQPCCVALSEVRR